MDESQEITDLLVQLRDGKLEVRERLIPLVYEDLRRIAARHLGSRRRDHTLESAALVHETYLRLVRSPEQAKWESRAHFFAVAATVMRRILVDYARSRGSLKRGGGLHRVSLDQEVLVGEDRLDQILAVDELLTRLSQWNERHSRVFELYFFGGMSQEEIAEAMNISIRTVKRDWSLTRAWLRSQLNC
jgi:RNA polymerase sigma-70 factor, ECF subfamily